MSQPSTDSPVLAVLAVVVADDRALLVRRRNPPDAGLWGFPGGKVDFGETVQQAAARELAEETAVIATPGRVLGALDLILRDDAGRPRDHFHLVAVQCSYLSGEPMAGDDAADARWVAVDEILNAALPMSADVDRVVMLARDG